MNNDGTDEIIVGAVDEDRVESSVYVFDCMSSAYPCTFSDDFEDGAVDPERWITGCAARGWDASQPQGTGPWVCSAQELVGPDGYLQMEVQGPTSGNTYYGAEAWALTSADFNNGSNHVIDFTWEVEAVIPGWYDNYYIQITDGFIPALGSVHWPYTLPPIEGTVNLAVHELSGGGVAPGFALLDGLAKTTWSIVIFSDGTARLYDGPGGTGNLLHQEALDLGYPWHLRLMVIDATSSGFPAGHDRLKIYDIAASCGGCCIARVGDVNNSGADEPTIGDIAHLVDHLFILKPVLECVEEADVNQSGGLNPTQEMPGSDITIGDIADLVNYLFIDTPEFGTLLDCL